MGSLTNLVFGASKRFVLFSCEGDKETYLESIRDMLQHYFEGMPLSSGANRLLSQEIPCKKHAMSVALQLIIKEGAIGSTRVDS